MRYHKNTLTQEGELSPPPAGLLFEAAGGRAPGVAEGVLIYVS